MNSWFYRLSLLGFFLFFSIPDAEPNGGLAKLLSTRVGRAVMSSGAFSYFRDAVPVHFRIDLPASASRSQINGFAAALEEADPIMARILLDRMRELRKVYASLDEPVFETSELFVRRLTSRGMQPTTRSPTVHPADDLLMMEMDVFAGKAFSPSAVRVQSMALAGRVGAFPDLLSMGSWRPTSVPGAEARSLAFARKLRTDHAFKDALKIRDEIQQQLLEGETISRTVLMAEVEVLGKRWAHFYRTEMGGRADVRADGAVVIIGSDEPIFGTWARHVESSVENGRLVVNFGQLKRLQTVQAYQRATEGDVQVSLESAKRGYPGVHDAERYFSKWADAHGIHRHEFWDNVRQGKQPPHPLAVRKFDGSQSFSGTMVGAPFERVFLTALRFRKLVVQMRRLAKAMRNGERDSVLSQLWQRSEMLMREVESEALDLFVTGQRLTEDVEAFRKAFLGGSFTLQSNGGLVAINLNANGASSQRIFSAQIAPLPGGGSGVFLQPRSVSRGVYVSPKGFARHNCWDLLVAEPEAFRAYTALKETGDNAVVRSTSTNGDHIETLFDYLDDLYSDIAGWATGGRQALLEMNHTWRALFPRRMNNVTEWSPFHRANVADHIPELEVNLLKIEEILTSGASRFGVVEGEGWLRAGP